MSDIHSDQDVDDLVWSKIQGSSNPDDFLDFIRHAANRHAEHELAFTNAEMHWENKQTPRLFYLAVRALEQLAAEGNTTAIYHLGRWFRLGYGVEVDLATGVAWYQKGADLGCSRSLINLARYTANQDVESAVAMFKTAAETYGDLAAHCYWAEHDKPRYEEHLRLGADSSDPFAQYFWAFHRAKVAVTPEEKSSAMDCMRSYAEKGNGYACMSLGHYYRNGMHGCTMDEETSLYWSKRGAAMGNENACVNYGLTLFGSPETKPQGLIYLKRAAMLGDDYAQSALGSQLLNHGPTPEVQAQGVHWLRAACRQSYLPAMSKLADALQHGKGCQPDPKEALHWLEKGTQSGNADCQTALGTCYMYGDLLEKNQEKAHNLFYLASLQGDTWATYLLGVSYECGHGTPEDSRQAFECYRSTAEKGLLSGAYKVGLAYVYGEGVEKDIPAGAKWLHKAAKDGHADAQAYMGMMFLYGHGVEENKETAQYWLKLSVEKNNRIGLRELALLYAKDDLNPEKRAEAVRLMANAASQGDAQAKQWIEEHCPERPEWLKGIEQLVSKNASDETSD